MPDEHNTVRGRVGEPVDLPLAQGPPTGYVWSLQLPPGVQQVEDGAAQPPPPGQHLGAGSRAALRVVAARAGEYTVLARLSRPWQPEKVVQFVHIRLIVE